MIQFNTLTLKNFLLIGQLTQTINLNKSDLTLILGDNLDMGGDGSRNGAGKSTIFQGLSYVLFGKPLTSIRKDLLINRTNTRNMLVTLDFTIGSKKYRIERGRKPNVFRFEVDGHDKSDKNDAQGDSRETQAAIEQELNMSHEMFKQIVALNTYNTPFLEMPVSEQRAIIEQLLGITMLSEKAKILKDKIKETADVVLSEEFRIKGVVEANKRIVEQIESLKVRQTKSQSDLATLLARHDVMSKLAVDSELQAHQLKKTITEYSQNHRRHKDAATMSSKWQRTHAADITKAENQLTKLREIDIKSELENHEKLTEYNKAVSEKRDIDSRIGKLTKELAKEEKNLAKLITEVDSLSDHRCYACGQSFHNSGHDAVLRAKQTALADAKRVVSECSEQLGTLKAIVFDVGTKPVTHYASITDATMHQMSVTNAQTKLSDLGLLENPHEKMVESLQQFAAPPAAPPVTYYDNEADAIAHREKLEHLEFQILEKSVETDPYAEQLEDMNTNALQVVNYAKMNEMTRLVDHQKFLLDLLVNKDSFIRKRIIDQNLSHLNSRLTHYLDKIGLPHKVVFLNDLSVEITEFGRDLDYGNLSRGESNRLILALSFAFRDIWESIYSPINIVCVDELIDSGLDIVGVENALAMLKDMTHTRGKSCWLISHREELAGRVQHIVKAVKQNGFGSYT